ncbi:PucR family transcriptional regulator [Amycolatopsis balhimycina DSM 5908]|uniref:PucR family transcriptional regulator n=1 Tax=Amycolatopsis balhimycina DSM 5908 TaxID=1081091 RepID=A0A428VXL4_AMYBA|nr:helix-turn-helix domain-containing protein [Amycolatopsis balhimycina]RSM35565.1 PucR family transcriptional regulator [Amycolatopsis balhimycina DSM 5908]
MTGAPRAAPTAEDPPGKRGSKTRTAAATGLSRPTLYSRLARFEQILGVPPGFGGVPDFCMWP